MRARNRYNKTLVPAQRETKSLRQRDKDFPVMPLEPPLTSQARLSSDCSCIPAETPQPSAATCPRETSSILTHHSETSPVLCPRQPGGDRSQHTPAPVRSKTGSFGSFPSAPESSLPGSARFLLNLITSPFAADVTQAAETESGLTSTGRPTQPGRDPSSQRFGCGVTSISFSSLPSHLANPLLFFLPS